MAKQKIKFLKIRSVKSPTRAFEFDAGIDFYVPGFSTYFLEALLSKNPNIIIPAPGTTTPYIVLPPGEGVMIPSGIKSRMSEPGRALIAANKSGIATKHKLTFGAQVVDYTYKGEIHLHLINNSNNDVNIYEHQKILQFLETPIFNSEVEVYEKITEKDEISFYDGLKDDRGAGGFGSTDKK